MEGKLPETSIWMDEATAADRDQTTVGGGGGGEKYPHFCTRKRCERHKLWQKQALADVRFEESNLADQMRRLEREEREVREGAMLRWRKELGAGKDGERREGWVEIVGAEAVEV